MPVSCLFTASYSENVMEEFLWNQFSPVFLKLIVSHSLLIKHTLLRAIHRARTGILSWFHRHRTRVATNSFLSVALHLFLLPLGPCAHSTWLWKSQAFRAFWTGGPQRLLPVIVSQFAMLFEDPLCVKHSN